MLCCIGYNSSNGAYNYRVNNNVVPLKDRPNWFHMIYVPPAAMPMEETMARATGSMLALRNWFVSVRLTGDHSQPAVEGAIRAQVVASKNTMVEVRGQQTDLILECQFGGRAPVSLLVRRWKKEVAHRRR